MAGSMVDATSQDPDMERQGTAPPSTTSKEWPAGQLGFDPAGNCIRISADWEAKDGCELIENLYLGKILGAGMQGQIFELKDGTGRIAPIVLKVVKKAALIGDMEREWEAGQKISQLADKEGNLPGFMKVGPCLRRPDDKIVGQVLERLNGKSVSKVFNDGKWAKIEYIRDLMLEVFTALDKAQRKFGFHHCDFRLENVMEHFPSKEHDAQDAVSIAVSGHPESRMYKRQFKMIDYGLAKFDDHYSAAHGWLEKQAEGEVTEIEAKQKLAYLEWVHHTAWKGKGDVYHLVFDITQNITGRLWPADDQREVELLLMLVSHICGVKPKTWIQSETGAARSSSTLKSTPSSKYAAPQQATTAAGKTVQFYMKYSRIHRWGRKLKAWWQPHNPGVTAAEILTAAFFYQPAGRKIVRPSSGGTV